MRTGSVEDMIVYEDAQVIVCHKPAGVPVQSAGIGKMDLESLLMNALAQKQKGKIPYLGIIHRLDQPVEGLLVFAKTKKAAADLNAQLNKGELKKGYRVVTMHKPEKESDTLIDYLKKDGRANRSEVTSSGDGKKAVLHYRLIGTLQEPFRYLLSVEIETGRHHQIRVQMAHHGMPLAGDRKYNEAAGDLFSLGLCADRLSFRHPATGKRMEWKIEPQTNVFVQTS